MNKNKLTNAVLTALLLTSASVMAANDYPAADFQPKVVYSDSSAATSSAPAAKAAEPAEVDPKFPAASFQPKVVFNDDNYKHSAAAPGKPAAAASASTAAVATDEVAVSAEKPAENNNLIFILAAAAAAGYFLFKKPCAKKSTDAGVASSGASNVSEGATGVEKYLEKQGINKTGVAKYLEKQSVNPATGVAKYVAKQVIKDREIAASKTTGVERYLRDKG